MLRLGVLLSLTSLLVMAGGMAHAAKPKQAVFRVGLTAKLTKDWTFTRAESETGCPRTTRGVGHWETTLSTRARTRVRAVAASGGRVRFTSATLRAIAGTATQSGTMTLATRGAPPCDRLARTVRCDAERRSFSGASVAFGSPRRGVLQFRPLRGAAQIRAFNSGCPEETDDIRTIRTDLPLATGPLAAADVFTRDVGRWFVSGESEQVTMIDGEVSGRVTERVRWTLTFTRIAR